MTTTLDAVSSKKHHDEDRSAEAAAAAELVRMAKEQGLALTGPDGLVKLFTKDVLETALNEDDALEARFQRIRHHLPRPLSGRGDLLYESRRKHRY